ncbi:MAG: hypothetical protein ACRCWQ_06490, partial [Bacilli bacterium]
MMWMSYQDEVVAWCNAQVKGLKEERFVRKLINATFENVDWKKDNERMWIDQCGDTLHTIKNTDSLFTESFVEELGVLFSKQEIEELKILFLTYFKGPSTTRSEERIAVRSPFLIDYTKLFFELLMGAVRYKCYNISLSKMLKSKGFYWDSAFTNQLVLSLVQGNVEIESLLKEAIYGEGMNVSFKSSIAEAIIRSEHPELLLGLEKLLQAAALQEGVRESILHEIKWGSIPTLQRFLLFIQSEGMLRFRSVSQTVSNLLGIALQHNSNDVLNAMISELSNNDTVHFDGNDCAERNYITLWALYTRNFREGNEVLQKVMHHADNHVKQIPFYWLIHWAEEKQQMKIAFQFIEEKDPILLHWIVALLSGTSILYVDDIFSKEKLQFQKQYFPADKDGRKILFTKLLALIERIGKKPVQEKMTILGWSMPKMSTNRVFYCLFDLLMYDRDEAMIEKVYSYLSYMSADVRFSYHLLFSISTNDSHRPKLYAGLFDRS